MPMESFISPIFLDMVSFMLLPVFSALPLLLSRPDFFILEGMDWLWLWLEEMVSWSWSWDLSVFVWVEWWHRGERGRGWQARKQAKGLVGVGWC